MAHTNNTFSSKIGNMFLSAFVPGTVGRRIVLGICLGISITGFLNIMLLSMLSYLHVSLVYAVLKAVVWLIANTYLVVSYAVSKDINSKFFVSKKPMNNESVAQVSLSRAA